MERQEGPQGLELAGEAAPEGRGGAMSVCHVLSINGPDSPPLWGGDLGFVRGNVPKDGGGTCRFPKEITEQREVQQEDRTSWKLASEKVLEKVRTQSLGTYIDRRQSTVTEWVALHPILEVCDRETGYKGGGRRHESWWRYTVARKQMSATLREILAAAGSDVGFPSGVAGAKETVMKRS